MMARGKFTWEKATPRPLLTGINEIAAIYDLGDLPDAVG